MKPKILVIDDEYSFSEFARIMLDSIGCDVVTCNEGRKALSVAQAEKPNLILLDLSMPDVDGLTVLKHFKSDPVIKEVPVLLCTLSRSQQQISEAFHSGAIYYISKPLRKDELKTKLKKLIGFEF